jgi:hypothetical protein
LRFIAPSRSLLAFMLVVDLGFILYWLTSALHLLPADWLYAHHEEPVMMAWNNSFFPLDLMISATGLTAVALARKQSPRWPLVSAVSLAFTSASGLNAIAFWALRRDFDMSWWAPNLVLFCAPLYFLHNLYTRLDSDAAQTRIR